MTYSVTTGLTYNLVVQAPALLGTSFSNVKIDGVVSYSMANFIQPDLIALHAQVYPYLAPGVSEDATQLSWIVLITPGGERRVIAAEWLATAPELAVYRNKIVRLTQPTPAQVQLLQNILVTSGFTSFSIEDAA